MNSVIISEQTAKEILQKLEKLSEEITHFSKGQLAQRVLTEDRAADLLGVSIRQLRHLRSIGKIGFAKLGRKVLFLWEDIEAYLKQHRHKAFR